MPEGAKLSIDADLLRRLVNVVDDLFSSLATSDKNYLATTDDESVIREVRRALDAHRARGSDDA